MEYNQLNWVRLLPIAKLAINNLLLSIIGTTPFFVNYSRNPNIMDKLKLLPKLEKALKYTNKLEIIHR